MERDKNEVICHARLYWCLVTLIANIYWQWSHVQNCKQWDIWENEKGTQEYTDWKFKHSYSINHEGSAGAMEVNWLKRIFSRSIRLHKLRYNFYIRDDDSKCFNEIIKLSPYPGHNIEKGECIGHVQKWVGTWFRSIKKDYKKKKLLDGKGIGGGKERLTDKVINTLQNHYGIAIRQNIDNFYAMRKAVELYCITLPMI